MRIDSFAPNTTNVWNNQRPDNPFQWREMSAKEDIGRSEVRQKH